MGTTATRRNIVLVCEVCGERTVLEGPLAVWHSGRTTFACECGKRLTLADRPEPTEQPKKVAHPAHLEKRRRGPL